MGKGCASASRRVVERAAFLVVETLEQRRLLSAAPIDPTYGTGGVVQSDFQASTFDTSADAVAFGSDVLTAGNASGRATLVAYDAADARDASFGSNGAVAIPSDVLSEASRIQIDSSGRILVAGSLNNVAAVARFNSDGSVDTSFGNNGVATQPAIGSNVTAVQTDGSGNVIISGDGSTDNGAESSFALARFTDSGAVDTSFNGSGYLVSDLGSFHRSLISDIAMDGDKIVAAGNIDLGQAPGNTIVARYNPDGTLDSMFSGTGMVQLQQLSLAERVSVSQGMIFVGGQGGTSDLAVARLFDSGVIDTSYGNNPGKSDLEGYAIVAGVQEVPSDMKVDTDGSVLLVGSAGNDINAERISSGGAPSLLVNQPVGSYEAGAAEVVFNNNAAMIYGTEFTSAGGANFALVNLAEPGDVPSAPVTDSFALSQATATSVAAQPDGSAIVIGTATSDISTAIVASKYLPDGSPDPSFGTNGKATIGDLGDLSLVGVNTLGFNGTVTSTSDGAGGAYLLLQNGQGTGNAVIVLHITSSGTLDNSYDSNATYSDPNATLTPTSIFRGSDGSLYISGERSFVDQDSNQQVRGFILKLNVDGTTDSSFGDSGIVSADFDVNSVGGVSGLTALSGESDGSILGAGFFETSDASSIVPAAIHVDASGAALSIGSNASGIAVAPLGGPMLIPMGVAVDSSGGILLGGLAADTGLTAVERFDANGAVDSSYGSGGVASIADGSQFAGMSLQNNEIILATATTDGGAEVVRFDTTGQLDTNFDDDGIAPVATADPLAPVGIALAPSDRILVAGTIDGDFAVAALLHSDSQANNPPTATIQGNTTADPAPTTGFEGTAIHLTSIASDPDGDAITYAWSVTGTAGATVSGASDQSDFTFTPVDNGSFTVSLTVTDTHGASTTVNQAINIKNVPPTLTVSGASTTPEGSVYTLNLGSSDPGADTISSWTINWRDGTIQTVPGNPSTVTHTYADDRATAYKILTSATDEDGTYTGPSQLLTVTNVAPTASITGPGTSLVSPQLGTFTLTATDPSSVDQAAKFTFMIDWDGDGVADQKVVAVSGTQITHAFPGNGAITVNMTATDKDGGVSGVASTAVNVTGVSAQLTSDPLNPGQQMLLVNGTSGDDNIKLTVNDNKDTVSVSVSTVLVATFSTTATFSSASRIVVYGNDGNDTITHGGGFNRAVELYGGNGNDTLNAGTNGDILVGGTGDDSIVAGLGDDLLIGGGGADKLSAGGGEDILIAGSTSFDNDPASLNLIMAEWQSSRSFSSRIADLTDNAASPDFSSQRANGNVFLIVGSNTNSAVTVFDDSSKDTAAGGTGDDWFLVNISGGGVVDKVTGAGTDAVVTDV